MNDAQAWIERLRLEKHPEGGYYRETYRNKDGHSTAIYFLLPADEVSMFHRIKSDEVWHFYEGNELTIHILEPRADMVIGPGAFQAVVPGGLWFGATVAKGFALVGCTVAPGFKFADFELGDRAELTRQFPQHQVLIERLTRSPAGH